MEELTEGLYLRSIHQDPANRWDQNGSDDHVAIVFIFQSIDLFA